MNYPNFREIVIDTGPLLLFLVGFYHPKSLGKFNYKEHEFIILIEFLKNFPKRLVTPHVLTEVSNLTKIRLGEYFPEFIRASIKHLDSVEEEYVSKDEIIKRDDLPKFGITDASLLELADKGKLLLTEDAPLFYYCGNKGLPVVHLDTITSLS